MLHTINGLNVARGDRHAIEKRSSLVIPLASKVFWVCNMEVWGDWRSGEVRGKDGEGGGVSIKIKGSF